VTSNETLHVEKPQVKYFQGFGTVLQAQTNRRGIYRAWHRHFYSWQI